MDGNNSLKRLRPLGDRTAADTRVLQSDYILPREYVDQFADEGKQRARGPQVHVPQADTQPSREEDSYLVVEEPSLVDVHPSVSDSGIREGKR